MTQTPITVFVRMRPTPRVSSDIILDPNKTQMIVRNTVLPGASTLNFTFNYIFHSASQEEIFDSVGKPAVGNALDGYNSTIFAYGQTSAGKSFSSIGDHSFTYKNRGLLPRILEFMFQQINARHGFTFDLQFSALEIYNERLIDLLSNDSTKHLSISDIDGANGQSISIKNLSIHSAETFDAALELVFGAENVRSIAESSLNMQSSRAHCIYTIYLKQRSRVDETAPTMVTKLNVVDLAGSERASASISVDATGNFINKSLTFLEQVVNCLNQNAAHVPYRTSKLTHILKDSIGGNCKTYLLACIRPEPEFLLDTISTLRFAQRASFIKNTSSINLLNRYYDSLPNQTTSTVLNQRDLNSIIATAVAEALDAKSSDVKNTSNFGPVLSKIISELEIENKSLKTENLLLSSGSKSLSSTEEGQHKLKQVIDEWIDGRAKVPSDISSRDDYIFCLTYLRDCVASGKPVHTGSLLNASGSDGSSLQHTSAADLAQTKKTRGSADTPAKTEQSAKLHGTVDESVVMSIGEADAEMIARTLANLNTWKGGLNTTLVSTTGAPAPFAAIQGDQPQAEPEDVVEDLADKKFQEYISAGVGLDLSKKVLDAKTTLNTKKQDAIKAYQELNELKSTMKSLQNRMQVAVDEYKQIDNTDKEVSNILNFKEAGLNQGKETNLKALAGELESAQLEFQTKKEAYEKSLEMIEQLKLAEVAARQRLLLNYEAYCADFKPVCMTTGKGKERTLDDTLENTAPSGSLAVFNGAMKRAGLTKRK
ncbi:Kinesin, motor domain protein [Giardia duodenalis]|uniref:Kinesin, motor domain protein n=1 Tax=Giardia intestinalis TaxID=5741 RepID=V6TMP0_GIAIN|nr:Kinesin, motor domain protein [Giardia intestinalis]